MVLRNNCEKMSSKGKILDFIKKEKLCVLSTINNKGWPQPAVIEFSADEKLELIFDTFANARKVKNLAKNQDG